MFQFMSTNMTLFHGLGMFIFWGIVIYLIFSFVRNDETEKETALEILQKKFANGEITEEEYKLKKKILEEKDDSSSIYEKN